MEKLLKWSVANSTNDEEAKKKIGTPDPELLAQLFGGKVDDPTLMKQSMAIIMDEEAEAKSKEVAFENFEMLIENLDNANNIENLKLWKPLIELLRSNDEFKSQTCSCIGTAIQNNTKSQEDFLKYEDGLKTLIEISKDADEPEEVKLKSFYALSSLLRHNEDAYGKFNDLKGWDLIASSPTLLSDKLKLRMLSLFSSLLSTGVSSEKRQIIQEKKILLELIELLTVDQSISILDKIIHILTELISGNYKLNDQECDSLTKNLKNLEPIKDRLNEDDFKVLKQVIS
ncbi:hypothetical protein PACTADRAFT_1030 [Pachysolen tannophilus NRRL Y-2460]|uniref:Hsp70 nucleotide exchange factor FES1 n=1 Tax=Pachysolen tannophilus NRRL Y-2460 TaxID=669874 RepID=A0A1E4U3I3_PACTA|nr:hypothetical protein PACTADRAFT_1030 [Pachysolen tannophilus NRRL Y-2460]